MSKGAKEFITGMAIGLFIGMLFFGRLALGASLSNEDIEMINRVVELESGNQSLQGKRYVVSVILNRIDDPAFPDTASEVISQPNQFSTYSSLQDTTPTWKRSWRQKWR